MIPDIEPPIEKPVIAQTSNLSKFKDLIKNPKYYVPAVSMIVLIVLSAFVYRFLNSEVKIGEIAPNETAKNPAKNINEDNIVEDDISEPSPYPVVSDPNPQPAANFSITNLDTTYKAKPFHEFTLELKPSNFSQSGGYRSYTFGLGDCSSDLSNCRTDNYAEYMHIDDFGYFHFIPTQNKTYEIPLWVLYQNNLFKGFLKINSSDAHVDNAANLVAYRINIPYPYKEALKDPQYANLGNLDVVKNMEPQTDCPSLKSRVNIREYNPYSCEVNYYKARGNFNIGIVYILPEGYNLPKQNGKDQIDLLDNTNPILEDCRYNAQNQCDGTDNKNKYLTFYYTNQYYKDQAKKYGVTDLNFKLKSYGRFKAKDVPHYGYDRDMEKLESVFNDAIGASTLSKIKAENDIVAYVYFDLDRGNQKAAFVSTRYNNNLYVNIDPPSEDFVKNTPYFQLASHNDMHVDTFIHELGHIFGAADKYKLSESRAVTMGCRSEGLGEPDKSPLFPQTKTDIYCSSTFESQSDFENGEGSQIGFSYTTVVENDRIIFNRYTAKEIGWIK